MRQVTLRVTAESRDDVESVLESHELDYLTIRDDGESGGEAGTLFLFPLPNRAVADVFRDIADAGVSEEAYTVLENVSYADTPRIDDVQQQYASGVKGLSRRELHAKVQELTWPPITYYVGTILSVIVATTGLLLDSPAIIIGSMVIAPQVSSALTMSAGVYNADWSMFVDAITRQFVGLFGAVVGAALFAWLAQATGIIPTSLSVSALEVMGVRLAPTSLSSIAALGAGAVGAFGYTTEQATSLVGVMITAAIVPAAAASGIAIAWANWLVAGGALLLLSVNMLAINVGTLSTLFLMGYRPKWVDQTDLRSSLPAGAVPVVSAVTVLVVFAIVLTGALTGAQVGYERSVNEVIDTTLSEPQYDGLRLRTVKSEYGGWSGATPNVTVTVERTSNTNYSSLPSTLERRIERRTGLDARVSVQYTESRSGDVQSIPQPAKLRTEPRSAQATLSRFPAVPVVGRPCSPTP